MNLNDLEVIAERSHKVVYRDGDTVLKVFDSDYSKAGVLNEALNQARVEETGLCIPRILEVLKIEDKWAIRTEYIEGETLRQKLDAHPEQQEEILKLFVQIQMDIHTKRAPLLTKLKDKMNRKISDSGFDATTRYELHTRLEGMKKHQKVCHGDLTLSDVIIRSDGTPFIIDWAHATQGNAAADVARSYLFMCLNESQELADAYLHMFCKMSDTALQYVQSWMPIVAASQSVKGHPEEQEFLARWVNVVDYS